MRNAVLGLVAVSCLVAPAPAAGGYDTAHIVKRTCEEGGPLLVMDEFKRAQDRDRVLTEPGEVIACPPAGEEGWFQIAAGPERIGGPYLCTSVSLRNGDGSDSCWPADYFSRTKLLEPLMVVRLDGSDELTVVGIAGSEVETVAVTSSEEVAPIARVVQIDAERAGRLGASGAFSYFWLSFNLEALCADQAGVRSYDGAGEMIVEKLLLAETSLLDDGDGLTYATRLKRFCEKQGEYEPATGWLTGASALVRSLLTMLI